MTKRKLEQRDFKDLSEVSPTQNAKVYAAITKLSPIKHSAGEASCSYYDGEICDGHKTMRLYGFQSSSNVRRKLLNFKGEQQVIEITECEIKPSSRTGDLEVKLNPQTGIKESERDLDWVKIKQMSQGKSITLAELDTLPQNLSVNINIKVLDIDEPFPVPDGRTKQDITIADNTDTARLTIWENEVGSLHIDKCYNLCRVSVRQYKGDKFLSSSTTHNSEITETKDIGEFIKQKKVSTSESATSHSETTVKNARIVGVLDVDNYTSCIRCTGKVTPVEEDPELSTCVKCQMTQCTDTCPQQPSVRILIKTSEKTFTLRAFGKTVFTILGGNQNVTTVALLRAQPFSFSYSGGIITSVRKAA